MKTISLSETGVWKRCELTKDQALALEATKLVKVKPDKHPGMWQLHGNWKVGAARVGPAAAQVELRIDPKLPVSRLMFLLGYAQKWRGWKDEEVDAGEHPELLPAVAYAFARAAERALRQGVLLGYQEKEESLTVVRGRIREAHQIRRRYGLAVPVDVRYDDYTTDIPENRLLLAAAHRLLGLPRVDAETRKLLRRLLQRLDGVRRPPPGRRPPMWTPTRLNVRYHTALGLAGLVLRGGSYEHDDGTTIRVDGLMLDMWRVFEDFLSVALDEALRPHGWRAVPQETHHRLDHARKVKLRPDLVCYSTAGKPMAVVDAKYKLEDKPGKDNSDLYQLLAYCTVLGLKRGHLVFAGGMPTAWVHRIAGTADVRITESALDLALPPNELLAQIDRLAHRIVGVPYPAAGSTGVTV